MQFIQPDAQAPAPAPPITPGVIDSMWDEKQFLEVLKYYGEDDSIPDELKKGKWSIYGKALINTFLDEKDLPMIDIFNNILRIDSMTSKPAHLITFKEVEQLDQTSVYFFLTAKRAIGTSREKMNERTLQNTQIGQTISTQIAQQGKSPRGGFLRKFGGSF